MIVSADGLFYEYYPRISINEWNVKHVYKPISSGYIDDYPAELSKKITLIKYFRANFLERTRNRQVTREEVEDSTRGGPTSNMPFVIKWLLKDGGSIIMLSTGAILVRYEGGTIMNVEAPFDDITFLDKFGVVSSMPLAKAISLGRDDIRRRLEFLTNNITDIIRRLSRNAAFFVCLIIAIITFFLETSYSCTMSTYWKSLPRYYCKYCNYWCVENKIVTLSFW